MPQSVLTKTKKLKRLILESIGVPFPIEEEMMVEGTPFLIKGGQEWPSYLKEQLVFHSYNTIGNLLRFYESFKQQSSQDILDFYKTYIPVITPEHHTCVGLGLDLLNRITTSDFGSNNPEMIGSFYLVSAEECISKPEDYCLMKLPTGDVEKEHVAAAARVNINGRKAVILMDPGYHVGRVIIIMADGQFPHTGWFVQSRSDKCTKKYCYKLHENGRYVEWHTEEIRNGNSKFHTNLFYVEKAFANAIDVTERRNIVYGFRSLLKRNADGQIVAGMYFRLKENTTFTLIRTSESGERIESRIPIGYFQSMMDERVEKSIELCGAGLSLAEGRLRILLTRAVKVIEDEAFLNEIKEIDFMIDSGATYH
uniref:Uncharacterized protein n=1 Tax=Strigamia maritima TaxID=126957 RepID=T1JLG9_STRMM